MYKLLIVDDECAVRDGIRELLTWEEYGIEIIGEASNGEEALTLLSEYNPEIVICDIKMPVMDGLELIKISYEKCYKAKYIILSGFNEFEFVKQALRYNVEDYLLKPINREEFAQTISELVDKMEKEWSDNKESQEGFQILENNILNRLIKNNIDYKDFREKAKLLGINIIGYKMQIAVIDVELISHILDIGVDEQLKRAKSKIFDICKKNIKSDCCIVFTDMDGRSILIYKYIEGKGINAKINGVLNKIIYEAKTICNTSTTIFVGDKVNSYRQLHISFKQAIMVQDYKIVKGQNSIIFYEKICDERNLYPDRICIDYKLIEKHIKSFDKNHLFEYIEKVFEEVTECEEIDPAYIYYMVIEIMVCIIRVLRESGLINPEEEIDDVNIIKNILGIKNIDLLKQWIFIAINRLMECFEKFSCNKFTLVVNDMVLYVNGNYNKEISLKTLSEIMNYTPAYLGRLFKNETGELFSEYVNKVRLGKAKEFLKNTNKKVNDIAKIVGFINSKYFFSIFKKYTRLTPNEYRSKNSKNIW